MVKSPLIRPYFLGWGPLGSHENKNTAPKKQISSFLMLCCVLQLIHRMLGTKVGHSWREKSFMPELKMCCVKLHQTNCTRGCFQNDTRKNIAKTYFIQHVVSFHYFWIFLNGPSTYLTSCILAQTVSAHICANLEGLTSGVSISPHKVATLLPFPVFQVSSKNNQPCQTFLFTECLPAIGGELKIDSPVDPEILTTCLPKMASHVLHWIANKFREAFIAF